MAILWDISVPPVCRRVVYTSYRQPLCEIFQHISINQSQFVVYPGRLSIFQAVCWTTRCQMSSGRCRRESALADIYSQVITRLQNPHIMPAVQHQLLPRGSPPTVEYGNAYSRVRAKMPRNLLAAPPVCYRMTPSSRIASPATNRLRCVTFARPDID